jgi:DNA-binding transcriptional ArsR family regulator
VAPLGVGFEWLVPWKHTENVCHHADVRNAGEDEPCAHEGCGQKEITRNGDCKKQCRQNKTTGNDPYLPFQRPWATLRSEQRPACGRPCVDAAGKHGEALKPQRREGSARALRSAPTLADECNGGGSCPRLGCGSKSVEWDELGTFDMPCGKLGQLPDVDQAGRCFHSETICRYGDIVKDVMIGIAMSDKMMELVARRFRTLGEPFRLRVLQQLEAGEKTVGELAERLEAGQPNVSKHLAILHDAGLISRRREGTSVVYAVSDPMVFKLCELVCRSEAKKSLKDYEALSGSGLRGVRR